MALLLCCLAEITYGADITLSWRANVEPELSGYRVYYHPGQSAPPYKGVDANEGISPVHLKPTEVTIGNICSFKLTGIRENQAYYFVVTAVNTEGIESYYSNEVCINCEVECECEFYPNSTLISRGGALSFGVALTNNTSLSRSMFFGTTVTMPNDTQSGFVWGPFQIRLDPYQSLSGHKVLNVPINAKLGGYTFNGYLGKPGVGAFHECGFNFVIVP